MDWIRIRWRHMAVRTSRTNTDAHRYSRDALPSPHFLSVTNYSKLNVIFVYTKTRNVLRYKLNMQQEKVSAINNGKLTLELTTHFDLHCDVIFLRYLILFSTPRAS